MNLGDQITKKFIRSVACPTHGEYCEATGPFTPCRARINKAIPMWHRERTAARVGRAFYSQFPDQARGR